MAIKANADHLGCFQNGNTIYATVQFNGSAGETTASSLTAKVYNPTDTTTPTFTLSACGSTPCIGAVDSSGAPGL